MTPSPPIAPRRVRVTDIRQVAIDTLQFDLVPADRRALPPFEPGAHIDVHVPSGPVRQYSLCGDPRTSECYSIAVKKEPNSRGGSLNMHESLEVGSILGIGLPKNHFPLADDDQKGIFIAGGIGITPIRAMITALSAAGNDWELHYCARSQAHAAFYDDLKSLAHERVHEYFSEEPMLDVSAITRVHSPGKHLYCCGPVSLMKAVEQSSHHWPAGHVHFEWFSAPAIDSSTNQEFEVELQRSGVVLKVPAEQSVIDVLRDHGVSVPSSCEEGVCGTCETPVLGGEPEHRDVLLSPAEREASKTMMICVSRSRGGRIVLDI